MLFSLYGFIFFHNIQLIYNTIDTAQIFEFAFHLRLFNSSEIIVPLSCYTLVTNNNLKHQILSLTIC